MVVAPFFLLLAVASALAPLYTQREPVDKDGLRSYFVIFNDQAPSFGRNIEKVRSWLEQEVPAIDPNHVVHVYEIGQGFRGFSAWLSEEGLASIREHSFVSYVEEDQVMRATVDPIKGRLDWGQVRVNQNPKNLATVPAGLYSGTSYPNASDASWDWASGVQQAYINNGQNVFIWVLDTGVVAGHQEFSPGRVEYQYDATTGREGSAADCNGHGTHVAGSAAGNYRGVAARARIGAAKVLGCNGSGTNANVVDGINWIVNKKTAVSNTTTNILSASLGGSASTTTDSAINNAAANGVIVVVAAGNDGADACNYSPARATSAITVGATQSSDAAASFSNHGSCLNVFAPGVSIHSSYYSGTSTTSYATLSGTSMATPLVSGAIALYASRLGGVVSNSAARSAITSYSWTGVVTGLKAGTPDYFINAKWAK